MKRKTWIILLTVVALTITGVSSWGIIRKPAVTIQVADNSLFVEHRFKEGNYTVVWECDAGALSLKDSRSEYTVSAKTAYQVYSGINEKVLWSSADEDGFTYSTATVRIYVYKYSDDTRYYKCSDEVYTDTLTISYVSGRLVKSEKRVFGNPERKDFTDNWQQILVLDKQKGYVVLRFRYGQSVNSPKTVVWRTNVAPLCKAVFGDAPIFVPMGKNREEFIYNSDTVCYNFASFDSFYFDDTDVEEYPANITVEAFIEGKKGVRSHMASISMKYYYGENKHYTIN